MSDDVLTIADATSAETGILTARRPNGFLEATASWEWPGATIADNEALVDQLLAADRREQGAMLAADARLSRLFITDSLRERARRALVRGDLEARRLAELAFLLAAFPSVEDTPFEEVHCRLAGAKMLEALAWLVEGDIDKAGRAIELMSAIENGSPLTWTGPFALARALHALACGSREQAIEIVEDSLGSFATDTGMPGFVLDAQSLLEGIRRREMLETPAQDDDEDDDEERHPLAYFFAVWLAIERRAGHDPVLAHLRRIERYAITPPHGEPAS